MGGETEPAPTRAIINRHLAAVYNPFAMLSGMKLDLFTPLKDGPLSAEGLAKALGVNQPKLSPLLYALVSAELLTVSDGLFANTPTAAHFFVRGEPNYFGSAHELFTGLWSAALKTAESVSTGIPQAKFDFNAMSTEEMRGFFRGLHAGTMASGRMLVEMASMARFHHVLEVGGGSGGASIAICQALPELKATVIDLPSVTPITQEFVKDSGLNDRVRVITADVVQDKLEGSYDAAMMRAFIQVLSPEQAGQALRHVGEVVAPGGAIFILGRVLDDSRLSPTGSVGFNLFFLNVYDEGLAHTQSEHRGWLENAGFVDFECKPLPDGNSLISARKK